MADPNLHLHLVQEETMRDAADPDISWQELQGPR